MLRALLFKAIGLKFVAIRLHFQRRELLFELPHLGVLRRVHLVVGLGV